MSDLRDRLLALINQRWDGKVGEFDCLSPEEFAQFLAGGADFLQRLNQEAQP